MGESNRDLPRNVQTYFTDEMAREFVRVKQHYGIGSNADVVRFLIRKEARAIPVSPQAVDSELQLVRTEA